MQPPTFLTSIGAGGIKSLGLWPSTDNNRLHIVNEHGDTMDAVDLSTLRVIDTVSIWQELKALIGVSSAVPWRTGTQGLGRKGLGLCVKSILIPVLSRDSGWKR